MKRKTFGMKDYQCITHTEAIGRLCADSELWKVVEKLVVYLQRPVPESAKNHDWTRRLLSAATKISVERVEEGLMILSALGLVQRESQSSKKPGRRYFAESLLVEKPLDELVSLRIELGFFDEDDKVDEDEKDVALNVTKVPLNSEAEQLIFNKLVHRRILVYPNQSVYFLQDNLALKKLQPDFLMMIDGKAVILEVMGNIYHPPSTAVKDHERGRIFERLGAYRVFFYDAAECKKHPEEVLDEIISLVRRG